MEFDRENSFIDDNLKMDECKSEVLLGFSVENVVVIQVILVKEIFCNECVIFFFSLQKYMEYYCFNVCFFVLKDDNESEISELEDSDVENLIGEIVYQFDGLVYIIEDFKESGQNVQIGVNSKFFFMVMFLDFLVFVGEKSDQFVFVFMLFFLQIINIFYIVLFFGKLFIVDQVFLNILVLVGVGFVLYSFCVYDF